MPPVPEVLHIHAEEGLAKVFRHPDVQKIPRSNGHTAAPGKIEKEEEGVAIQITEGGQEAEEGSRIVEYFDTADKLGHIFEKLLKRLNVELHT